MSKALRIELKKIRAVHDERLLDMARRLNKSSSFISAVEVGRKAPPQGFEEEVIGAYALDTQIALTLRWAADQARTAFTIEPNTVLERETASLLARKISTLSEDDLRSIQSILRNSKE